MDSESHPEPTVIKADSSNWWPARTNTVLISLVTAVLVALLMATTEDPTVLLTSSTAGIGLALILSLAGGNRYKPLKHLCANILAFPVGALLLISVSLLLSVGPDVGQTAVAFGVGVAITGAVANLQRPFDTQHIRVALINGFLSILLPSVYVAFMFYRGPDAISTIHTNLSPTGLVTNVYWRAALTFAFGAVAIGAAQFAIAALPIVELYHEGQQSQRQRQLSTIQKGATRSALVSLVLFVIFGTIGLQAVREYVTAYISSNSLRLLATPFSETILWVSLISITLAAIAVTTVVWVMKRLGRTNRSRIIFWGLPNLLGLVMTVVIILAVPDQVPQEALTVLESNEIYIESFFQIYGGDVVVLGAAVGSVCALLFAFVLLRAASFIALPERAIYSALTSLGVFLTAVGSIITEAHPLVTFVLVGGGLVVWDIGSHAVSLGEEVGRRAQTRHAALVHSGGSVLIGSVGIGLAVLSLTLVGRINVPAFVAPLALLASLISVLVIVFGLRSR
jgi:hypothetical protein